MNKKNKCSKCNKDAVIVENKVYYCGEHYCIEFKIPFKYSLKLWHV